MEKNRIVTPLTNRDMNSIEIDQMVNPVNNKEIDRVFYFKEFGKYINRKIHFIVDN